MFRSIYDWIKAFIDCLKVCKGVSKFLLDTHSSPPLSCFFFHRWFQFATEAAITILRIDDMIRLQKEPEEERPGYWSGHQSGYWSSHWSISSSVPNFLQSRTNIQHICCHLMFRVRGAIYSIFTRRKEGSFDTISLHKTANLDGTYHKRQQVCLVVKWTSDVGWCINTSIVVDTHTHTHIHTHPWGFTTSSLNPRAHSSNSN